MNLQFARNHDPHLNFPDLLIEQLLVYLSLCDGLDMGSQFVHGPQNVEAFRIDFWLELLSLSHYQVFTKLGEKDLFGIFLVLAPAPMVLPYLPQCVFV